jgi:3-deoxy-D-arabino-heptulosonate 7-phosphate (DAHP) synthase
MPFSNLIGRTIVFLTHTACPKAIANFIVQRIIGMAKLSRTQKSRLAETPDVLLDARHQRTWVPVLDFVVGGAELVTMAGPCSVETESQLMATARHLRRRGARVLRGGAFKPRSSPYAFQGLGWKA